MVVQGTEQYSCHDASTFLMRHEGHQKIFYFFFGGGGQKT